MQSDEGRLQSEEGGTAAVGSLDPATAPPRRCAAAAPSLIHTSPPRRRAAAAPASPQRRLAPGYLPPGYLSPREAVREAEPSPSRFTPRQPWEVSAKPNSNPTPYPRSTLLGPTRPTPTPNSNLGRPPQNPPLPRHLPLTLGGPISLRRLVAPHPTLGGGEGRGRRRR